MIFIKEIDEEVYKIKIVNVYESKEGKTTNSSQNLMSKKAKSKSQYSKLYMIIIINTN